MSFEFLLLIIYYVCFIIMWKNNFNIWSDDKKFKMRILILLLICHPGKISAPLPLFLRLTRTKFPPSFFLLITNVLKCSESRIYYCQQLVEVSLTFNNLYSSSHSGA